MGSQQIQGQLWGQQPKNWSAIQELTGKAGYDFALSNMDVHPGLTCLDIGCGAGHFAKMISVKNAAITGLDASEALIAEARMRVPEGRFLVGEMEELPFDDNSFDLVSGFNSFQYAALVPNAVREAKRVLKPGGKLVAMIWGNKEDCEAFAYLKAVGAQLPPPPPGAPGPFALSENNLLEQILKDAGFRIQRNEDIPAVWHYPDLETAMKGLMSAGPVARAVANSGFEQVYAAVSASLPPFTNAKGEVIFHNKFRVVICEK